MDVDHDVPELCVNFLCGPSKTLCVLAHFEAGNCNAACVNCLGGSNDHAGLIHHEVESIVGGGHVSNFDIVLDAVCNDLLCGFHMNVILHCAGHDDIDLAAEGLFAGEEFNTELVCIVLYAIAAACIHFEHVVDLFFGYNAVGIVDVAIGAGEGNNLAAEFRNLLGNTPSNITEAGYCNGLAFDGVVLMLENFAEVVNSAETGCFGTDEGTAEGETFAGENAVFLCAADPLVLAEEITDYTAADTHITCGNVDAGSDMTAELGHEALAEIHDFLIGLAFGIEVGTALTAAHGKAGEAVFEGLLKAEELHDGKVNIALETETALVGSDRAVELNAEATVYLNFAVTVGPRYTEFDNALRLYETLKKTGFLILGMLFDNGFKGFENLFNSLKKLGFVRIALLNLRNNFLNVSVHSIKSSKK